MGIEYLFSQTGPSLGTPSDEESDGAEDEIKDKITDEGLNEPAPLIKDPTFQNSLLEGEVNICYSDKLLNLK